MLTFAWYVSILFAVGAVSTGHAFAEAPHWPRRLTSAGVFASALLLSIVCARLWSQTYDAFGGGDEPLVFAHARVILFETPWGGGWMWQASATVCAAAAVLAWRWRWSLWPLAALCGSVVAFVTALTGHAVGMEDLQWVTVLAHGLHVVAASWWIGGLSVILLITAGTDYERDTPARLALATVIDRFSPVAVLAVSVLLASGAVATWRHVIGAAGLGGFASPYGLALLAKMAAFSGAALCGLYNWRVLRPALASSPDAARQLRTMAWLEVSLGLVALVLTAVLGTLSMPEPPGPASH